MVGFCGRYGSLQYMPQKPTRWDIKAFTLADAANGYLLNSLVYTGTQTLDQADTAYNNLPQPARIVMDLMGQYLQKGYHLFTDRYKQTTSKFSLYLASVVVSCPDIVRIKVKLPARAGEREAHDTH